MQAVRPDTSTRTQHRRKLHTTGITCSHRGVIKVGRGNSDGGIQGCLRIHPAVQGKHPHLRIVTTRQTAPENPRIVNAGLPRILVNVKTQKPRLARVAHQCTRQITLVGPTIISGGNAVPVIVTVNVRVPDLHRMQPRHITA